MTMHYQYSDSVQPGDSVFVRWGRFGKVTAKVVKVYADGGLSCVRWNKRRECYTAPKRYYRTRDGHNWIEHDQADRTVEAAGDADLMNAFIFSSLLGCIGGLLIVNGIARGLGVILLLVGILGSVGITEMVR